MCVYKHQNQEDPIYSILVVESFIQNKRDIIDVVLSDPVWQFDAFVVEFCILSHKHASVPVRCAEALNILPELRNNCIS